MERPTRTAERRLFLDVYALTASTISSAAAGMLSYVLAARLFDQGVVGRAAAITSAMLLLSGVSQLDMANALHRFLPGSGRSAKRLILSTYLVVGVVSLVVTMLFVALLGEGLFGQHRVGPLFWFAGAVSAWSLFNLQDQVLMGLGASILIPLENTIFGLARITTLIAFVGMGAYAIVATWILPVLVLLVVVSLVIRFKVFPAHVKRCGDALTMWDFHVVSRFVAGSYVGGVTALATANVLPLIVESHLGSAANAHFYMVWVITSNIDLIALNFGISLVVQGATNPDHIPDLIRAALRKQLMMLGPVLLILAAFAHPILSIIFPSSYADASSTLLRLLCIGMAPRILWNLYLPAARLRGKVRTMAAIQVASSALVLSGASFGLLHWGLVGIGWGFLAAQLVMAVALTPQLYRLISVHQPKSVRLAR